MTTTAILVQGAGAGTAADALEAEISRIEAKLAKLAPNQSQRRNIYKARLRDLRPIAEALRATSDAFVASIVEKLGGRS